MVAYEGLGLAERQYLGLFYANNDMVGSRYLELLQGNLNMIDRLQDIHEEKEL